MGNAKKHIRGQKGSQISSQLRGIPFDQVLVVAIDASKYLPKALVCNYFGEILEDSFFFTRNSDGLNLLTEKIEKYAFRINAQKVIIGIEPTGQYHEDIVRFLENKSYSVSLVNAYTTFEERASSLNWSKTDDRDLRALVSALLANKVTETKLADGIYEKLVSVTRAYRNEVGQLTVVKTTIRELMDRIWPGFQGGFTGKPQTFETIFSDFWGKTPTMLMEHYPHPQQILHLGKEGLQAFSRANNLKMRTTTIEKLLLAATQAVSRSPEDLDVYTLLLSMKLQQLKQQKAFTSSLKHKMEELFVQTPGILLLSVPEIGVITAAALTAEIGTVDRYQNAGQIIKRAGTDSLISQSGGTDAKYRRISKQGNRHLRSAIYMAGFSLATGRTNPYFKEYAKHLQDAGKGKRQSFIAAGNKFIRIAYAMLKKRELFSPPAWTGEPLNSDILDKIEHEKHRDVAEKRLQLLKEEAILPEERKLA